MATAAPEERGQAGQAAPPAPPSGPAHVGVVSFLAARAAPSGGFWIALAGGVALARVAQRRGARLGFGASLAAMLETVAIIGPARIGIPLTQAATAPLLGRLDARGWGVLAQIVACGAIRIVHNTATTAFFIWVVTGGLDAYAGTYDTIGRRVGLEVGSSEALVLTAVVLVAWAAFASTVQVLVYRRGLRAWDTLAAASAGAADTDADPSPERTPDARQRRFDPRAIMLAAVLAFVLLLVSTAWVLLAAVALWLALAWSVSRADRDPVATGLVFAAVLGLGGFVFVLLGGLGLDLALRRGLRAALLVLVATWLRAAAGAEGLREVFRRVLGRIRALPSIPEAIVVLDGIAAEGRLAAAGRSLIERLKDVSLRPLPLLDAVLVWVVAEAGAFRPLPPGAALRLTVGARDLVLVVAAALPAATLVTVY